MKVISFAALSASLAVALGAFGAHGLKAHVDANDLAIWQTAVTYHMWHSLALLAVGIAINTIATSSCMKWVVGAFIFGIIIFSGSLYLLVLTNIRWLGAITPIGGTAFIVGWLLLTKASWSFVSKNSTHS